MEKESDGLIDTGRFLVSGPKNGANKVINLTDSQNSGSNGAGKEGRGAWQLHPDVGGGWVGDNLWRSEPATIVSGRDKSWYRPELILLKDGILL